MSVDDRIPPEDQRCECACHEAEHVPATTRGEDVELWLCDDCAGIVPERARG